MELGVKQTQVQNWAPPLLGLCDLNFSFLIGQVKLLIPVSEDFPEDYKCVKKPPPHRSTCQRQCSKVAQRTPYCMIIFYFIM